MSNRIDLQSSSIVLAMIAAAISSATNTDGEIIDTLNANDKNFGFSLPAITSGDAVFQILESDDSGMSGATVVASEFVAGANYNTVIPFASMVAKQTYHFHVSRTMSKRYLQTRIVSSNTPVYTASAIAVLGSLTRSPLDTENVTVPV